MKYRGIFEYEYPTKHKPPVSIDVHLHGDCVKGKIIEWEYRPLEQEPFINKPCISSEVYEHDKNKVLDKIREQIKSHLRGVEITLEVLVDNDPLRPKMEGAKDTLEECLEIIDKSEIEPQESEDNG